MQILQKIVDNIVIYLEELDLFREDVVKQTRKLNRLSGRGIAILVMGGNYDDNLNQARKLMKSISEIMNRLAPTTSWRITSSGVEEYIEFEILQAIIKPEKIQSPEELGVPPTLWITALCDVLGEIRRIILNKLIAGDVSHSKDLLLKLQVIYNHISGIVFPKTLTPNLRRKIDVARSIMERTESDIANAILSQTK